MITEYGCGRKESGNIVMFLGEILAVAFDRALLQIMVFNGTVLGMFVLWEIWKLTIIEKAFLLPRGQATYVFRKNLKEETETRSSEGAIK
jgi:hypothetical protein